MAEPQLSVRSAKARDLVHWLERALESYQIREAGRESAAVFYARLSAQVGTDIHLERVIREGRKPHGGVDL